MHRILVENYYNTPYAAICWYNSRRAYIDINTSTGEFKYLSASGKGEVASKVALCGSGTVIGLPFKRKILAYYVEDYKLYFQYGAKRWQLSNDGCLYKYKSYFLIKIASVICGENVVFSKTYINNAFKNPANIIDLITWDEIDSICTDLFFNLSLILETKVSMTDYVNFVMKSNKELQ